jgi:hypothetical protein
MVRIHPHPPQKTSLNCPGRCRRLALRSHRTSLYGFERCSAPPCPEQFKEVFFTRLGSQILVSSQLSATTVAECERPIDASEGKRARRGSSVVEQWSEEPCVASSILALGTTTSSPLGRRFCFEGSKFFRMDLKKTPLGRFLF